MNRPVAICTMLLGVLLLAAATRLRAEEPADLARWQEDFADEAAFLRTWTSYGWLEDGKTVRGPEHMARWWQIHDG
ncbi:MAG: hypothetical protein ACKOB1_01570, partial [Planctomycetia bacterium]